MFNTLVTITASYFIYLLLTITLVGAFVHFHHHYGMFGSFLVQLVIAFILGYAFIVLLQTLFPTDRPFVVLATSPLIAQPSTPSFPSSHAVYSGILAGFLGQVNGKWGIVGSILAITIGVGRVLALVHYPIDVLVGLSIGVLISLAVPHLWFRKLV
jgi:undecaprenyl-diphosphatase